MTNHTDTHSLYVLLISLLGTVIALPAVWYFTAAPLLLLVSLPNFLRVNLGQGSAASAHHHCGVCETSRPLRSLLSLWANRPT
jgi:hypothetical protein